jgi:GntR family transcriptional repressor for pyruvate dehydrogenase complex
MRPSGLMLNPVSTERVSDVIAERLTAAIRDGTLKAGDRLPTEAELAREFQVGRTSVREGLQKLRAHGLIESRKGLGAFVMEPKSDPLGDFARWTASDPAELEHLNDAHRNAEGTAQLVATDQAFHAAIMTASRNRFVQGAYDVLIAELTDFREKTLALPWASDRSFKGHDAIVSAIGRREPVEARHAMAEHLWVLYSEIEETAAAEGRDPGLPLLPRDAIS